MAAGSIAIILVPGGRRFPCDCSFYGAGSSSFGRGEVPHEGLALWLIIWAAQTLLVLIAGSISLVSAPIYNQARTKNRF